jgi:acetyl-CoA carboxylase carboxyl transferase subunit alpha
LGIIDLIVKEPLGAAHRDHQATLDSLGDALEKNLKDLLNTEQTNFRSNRRMKFLEITKNKLL